MRAPNYNRYFSCIDCGKETTQTDNNTRKRCPDCVKVRTYTKIDERKSRLVAEGKCYVCAKERDEDSPSKNMCSICIGRHKQRMKDRRGGVKERFCETCQVSLGYIKKRRFCSECMSERLSKIYRAKLINHEETP